MTGSKALGRRIVLLLALVVAALGVPAPGRAAPPTLTPAARHTHLVLQVDGCARCTVTLVQAISGTSIYWHSRAQRVGADGRAVFDVPARRTHGMSFELRVPWESGLTDSVLNVATRYSGQAAGETWTARQAKHARRAFGCWAGTARRRATLHVKLAGFTFRAGANGPQRGATAWMSPGVKSWRPAMRAWHGRIGNQDAYYCERP